MMRKTLAIIFLLTLLVTACSSNDSDALNEAEDTGAEVTVFRSPT